MIVNRGSGGRCNSVFFGMIAALVALPTAAFSQSARGTQTRVANTGRVGTMTLMEPVRTARDVRLEDAPNPFTEDNRKIDRPFSLEADGPVAFLAMPNTPAVSAADVLSQMPDPRRAPAIFRQRLDALAAIPGQEPRVVQTYESVIKYAIEYLQRVHLPTEREMTLSECIRRALQHNFDIRAQSYNPAISQTQLVEAEAAFDAEMFLDFTYVNQDRAVANEFDAGQSEQRITSVGVRQLLPTGMNVSTRVQHTRVFTDFTFQTINPAYTTAFVTEIRQPLLRGFGLDVNRAQINIAAAQRDISTEQFIQQVRDILLNVETAYWNLVQARRTASILAESVAQNRATYESVLDRADFDATEVEIQNAKSGWDQRVVEFVEAVRSIRDAEDQIKVLLNDPELLLSRQVEIIPSDLPLVSPLQVDQLSDVRTALESRSEIRAARKSIDITRINVGVAKNQLLPQLDLSMTYTVEGVEDSADESLDRMTTNRFRSYTVGLNFSLPIGNRRARSANRRARLQESQAVAQLRSIMDQIVVEVNNAVRLLVVRWVQVPTQVDAVRAAERNLRALQARSQKIDPPYLQTELGAVEQLNNTRTRLLQIVTQYTTAVAQLERAKGTLLDYNNVTVEDVRSPR